MSKNGFQKMVITKFKDTGELGMVSSKERKQISNETMEDLPADGVDRSSCYRYSSTRVQAVSLDLSIP